MASSTSREYKCIFAVNLLLKSRAFLSGFALLAIVTGFSIPSGDLHDLIVRGLETGVIPRFVAIGALTIAGILNLAVIGNSLLTKYALRSQAILASVVVFSLLTILAIGGFWLRLSVNFETQVIDASMSAGTASGSRDLPLKPSLLGAALAVASTLSIFNVVYGLATGPYMKADYAGFQSSIVDMFGLVDTMRESFSQQPPPPLYEAHGQLCTLINNAIDSLTHALYYEPHQYRAFVRQTLLSPLTAIDDFLNDEDVRNSPELVLQLLSDTPERERWIEEKGYYDSFQEVANLVKGRSDVRVLLTCFGFRA